jgi:PTH2 family peptidyl-tRNA hydrolase
MDKDEEVVMYIIVNSDLKMGKGKIAAQVGHIVQRIVMSCIRLDSSIEKQKRWFYLGAKEQTLKRLARDIVQMTNDNSLFKEWLVSSYPKVILKASLSEYSDLMRDRHYAVYDEGRTQIADGSLTVIGFFPMRRKDAPKRIKELKLL